MKIDVLDQRIADLAKDHPSSRPAAQKLRDWLVSSDEIQRLRINPHNVAEACEEPVETMVTLALQGVATGLFDLHWLVHCPHCNMITKECGDFFELSHASDCKMCEVYFDIDVLKRVEVTFSLNRSIEDAEAAAFCLPPPVLEPKINIAVGPGGTVSGSDVIEKPGSYRFFCPITLARGVLEVSGEPTDEVQHFSVRQLPTLEFEQRDFAARPGQISFDLVNECDKVSGIFIIPDELPEELPLEALPPRLTGLEVIHYPEYRNMFGDQALAESEHLQVASVTLMFTDIAGSTAMYEKMGNAGAYTAVRRHFDLLFELVDLHGGFVVKTIGDAVMASFHDNDDAVSCAMDAQRKFRRQREDKTDDSEVHVKFGIHRGPAILVNLNGRTDYFGSTVNKAARIQDAAGPDELVISSEVCASSAVADTLLRSEHPDLSEERIELKGIGDNQTIFRFGRKEKKSPLRTLLSRVFVR